MARQSTPHRFAHFTIVAAFFILLPSVYARQATPVPAPAAAATPAQTPTSTEPALSVTEREAWLLKAKFGRTRGVSQGVTGTLKSTMTDGVVTHDAQIQTIDEYKQRFESDRGTEFNFRDSWRYNVAAYRLDRLLELGMIPPSVERAYDGKVGALTWWVDDVIMDETARLKKKVQVPDARAWNEQMWHVRMFDQLIYNVDRNLGNIVIDSQWRIWMVDHTRAFRTHESLKSPGDLTRIDRQVLEHLKALDKPTLDKLMKDYLSPQEIKSMLARRDKIVQHFEKTTGAIFEWNRPPRPAF